MQLASLNSRQILMRSDFSSDLHPPTPHFTAASSRFLPMHQPFSTIDVYVVTETVVRSDEKPVVGQVAGSSRRQRRASDAVSELYIAEKI